MSSVKKNFIYNIIYQILSLIIPLITAPYLARVIGAEGVGIYSYTYSIVYYFMLFTLIGVNNYGNREIAKIRENEDKLSDTFCNIFCIQLILGILMIIFYYIFLLFQNKYKLFLIINSIYIISSILDINWFFFGMEEFKVTILRNSALKILSVILIFVFVKNSSDIWVYILIMAVTTLVSQIVMWPFLLKKINIIKPNLKKIKKHLKPDLVLFIPVVAVSLYKIMDKIMLGVISSITEVGFYENAEKIINVPIVFITALGTVMLPRITNLISNGNDEKVNKYIDTSINFVMFFSLSMMFGLIATSQDFINIYLGSEFSKTGLLIILLSTTIPFISFANVIRTQYLIPREKDLIYVKSVILGAIVNFVMNILFIPFFQSIGACFGTIAAEIIVMLYQSLKVKNELPINHYFYLSLNFFIKSLIMFICVYLIKYLNLNAYLTLFLQFVFGIIIYMLLNIKYIKNNLKRKIKI